MAATEMPQAQRGLVVDGIVKAYAGTVVLRGISVAVAPGEVVGLVGHNGAGKSTLMKSISGAVRPDEGSVRVDGVEVPRGEPKAAIAAGVSTVYQELSLLPNLTVTQNVFLGREERRAGVLGRAAMRASARALIDEFHLDVDPDALVGSIPVATRQLLEVAIATHRDARYLLLDEPTTALEGRQVDRFLETVRGLADRGLGIVLVDHKLEELYAVCDRIVALVDGEVRIDGSVDTVHRADVVHAIAGDDVTHEPTDATASGGREDAEITVDVRGLATARLEDVTLQARAGRVLGIYGLVGAGRTELLHALAGMDRILGGEVVVHGRRHAPRSPRAAIRGGVVYVTEERKHDGIVPQLDSIVNLMLPVLHQTRRAGLLSRRRMRARAMELMDALRVRGDRDAPIERLSGGNQQKVVIARALALEPRVLLLDEPTKGVDLGVKAEIHRLVRSLAHERGITVILVSSEEDEVVDVADDVIVMSGRRTDGTLVPDADRTPQALRRIAWDAA
ncbi:sugar ABC transporter ATP-binding protein [Agrococcus sp. SGAir0287]|uniref:sugar ABC transporter ATP-binding protein n=1 Tax=Agrococcus sp. SGAir0287 TaxID=2070347 RepID=UPI0010CD59A2|nr:sugar ABC transporter ATP-binding protein [Agrococcus sp. SGAir0287]QCR18194.1 sugar ABC transporter ATP-binding protein [Agrococcus sp. SGAir0287]